MDIFKQNMRGPSRPAPAVPGFNVNRYSPVTNWNDDPFGVDVFEPTPQFGQKKKPPPRPPPPKVNKQPDAPVKPSHFIRKPTVLSSLLSRRNKNSTPNESVNQIIKQTKPNSDVDTVKIFPKCEPRNIQTGALIDLSSPPSSPTFTTRSSSDGLSVDSFGSDATTSTNHHNALNGGSTSQTESGFEDDFDLFLSTRKPMSKDDTFDDFRNVDPFSPPISNKPPLMKKPVLSKDLFDVKISLPTIQLNGPTIIRAKPARPKPPDNSALLKSTFGSNLPVTLMTVNTTTPIQKVTNGFGDNFEDTKSFSWDSPDYSPERESSPPMPTVPPPPPPPLDDDLTLAWANDLEDGPEVMNGFHSLNADVDTPHAIALFDYQTGHPEDLSFSVNDKITLIRRENAEWLFGCVQSGAQGLFPASYVEIKVGLPGEGSPGEAVSGSAVALYDLPADQPGDLPFRCGDTITLTHRINDEWYFGECNGVKGQFPLNYVQMNP